jgi:ribose transport system permease protein
MATPELQLERPVASWEGAGQTARALLAILHRYSFSFALLLTLVLLATNLVRTPNFGWSDQLANFAPLAIAGMASTPAIISGRGGLDISISPVMILTTGVFAVWLAPHGLGGAVAVPLLLLLGTAIGAVNGLLIVWLRLPPVVVTLAVYFILIGINLTLLTAPVFVHSTWITELSGSWGPFPAALLTIAVPLVVWSVLGLLPYRRTLYAVGSNDATAFSCGVKVGTVRVAAYALGGLFAAVGGFAVLAVTSTASPNLSGTYALQAIAAVALGGTALQGGRGGLIGSALGAASIYLLGNLLISFNVNPSWLQVMYGTMLLLAVVLVGLAARTTRRGT